MRRVFLILAACLSAALSAGAEEPLPLTLEQAVNLALERNRDLARSRTLLGRDEQGLIAAEAAFAFAFRPEGGAGAGSSENAARYGLRARKLLPIGTEIELIGTAGVREDKDAAGGTDGGADRLYSGRAVVEITQPLFRNYGRLVNEEGVADARDTLRAARRALELETASTILAVAAAFTACTRTERQLAADTAAVARLEQLAKLAATRERQGRSTRVDRMRVELQQGQARTRLSQGRERLRQARLELAELTGLDEAELPPAAPPPEFRLELPAPESAVRAAYSNRLDYAQALENHRRGLRLSEIARRSLWPDISLIGRAGRLDEGRTAGDAFAFGENEWFIGLAAGRDYNPRLEQARLASAEVDAEGALQYARILEVRIARTVRQRLGAYQAALAETALAAENLLLAQRRAELARRLFTAGRGDAFTVSDAETALQAAESAGIEAQAALLLAGFHLMNEMGALHATPGDLKPARTP